MRPALLILFASILSIIGYFNFNTISPEHSGDYAKWKSTLDSNIVDHFPQSIISPENTLLLNTNSDKNNVGLYLYLYQVDKIKFDSLISSLTKFEIIAKYNSVDTCMLIVNRFETTASNEYGTKPVIPKGAIINKDCYEGKLPIPNFIDFHFPDTLNEMRLSRNFEICVLGAEKRRVYKKYMMKPDVQMPGEWANGYSKGFAFNRNDQTLIYWTIIW